MILLCDTNKPWLIEYWPQLTFILLAAGYVIQTIWGKILKEKEIKYSQVTQNKISELKSYIKNYNELIFVLKDYYYVSTQNLKEKLPEHKEKVYKSWINFVTSYGILRIFLKKTEYAIYEEVRIQLEEIQRRIIFNEIDKFYGTVDKDNVKEVWEVTNEIFPKKLPELISIIEDSLKEDMNIK